MIRRTDAGGYIACYLNDNPPVTGVRLNGHVADKSYGECEALALAAGEPFFGLEDPNGQSVTASGTNAACLIMNALPSQQQAAEIDCKVKIDTEGKSLGGAGRLAVYSPRDLGPGVRPGSQTLSSKIRKLPPSRGVTLFI